MESQNYLAQLLENYGVEKVWCLLLTLLLHDGDRIV